MKNVLFILVIMLGLAGTSIAQKFAYVDSEYILKNIPEYTQAQAELDKLSEQWQKEIEEKYQEIEKLYQAFQAEAIVLPDDEKTKRETEIVEKEKEAKELQKKRFGRDGDLYKKRQELIKPIQDKIYNAIKELAELGKYSVIFDKSSGTNILFADEKLDKSDEVLKKLGYKPGNK